jgi:hypothetical protein
MNNIYTAVYKCKVITPIHMPGYNDVRLGLPGLFSYSDIVIHGTVSRFVVGKDYLINVSEM